MVRLLKYLDVPYVIIFLLVLAAATLWSLVIYFHVHTLWLIIPLAAASTYVAILALYWLVMFILSKRLQEELEVWDIIRQKSVALSLSMEMNLCFSVYYLYVAHKYGSSWFAFVAVFYISLTIARFMLLRQFCFENHSLVSQYKRYIAAGYFMVCMMICLFFMSVLAVQSNYVVNYPGHSIYVAAVFSLILIVSAIYGYFRYRKYRSPLLSGNQMVSISAALLGILSLQTAFLPMFFEDDSIIHLANLITAIAIFFIMILMSVYMIVHGSKELVFGIDENGERCERKDIAAATARKQMREVSRRVLREARPGIGKS